MLKALAKKLTIALFLSAAISFASGVKAELIPTKVESLRDIKSYDWAYLAVQKLSDRYGCRQHKIELNSALTRYEFALILKECLDKIKKTKLLPTDVLVIQKLGDRFAAEFERIDNRVNSLSERIKFLEKTQFSPVTQLQGTFLIQIGDTFGDRARFPGNLEAKDTTVTFFGYQSKLRFNNSFTGRDRLRIEIEAQENTNFDSEQLNNTRMTRPRTSGNSDGFWKIDEIHYSFPVLNNRGRAILSGTNIGFNTIAENLNPASAIISRFARRNPLTLRESGRGGGIRLALDREKNWELVVAYLSRNAENTQPGNGLFNSSFAMLNQLVIEPTNRLEFTLDYVRKYQNGARVNLNNSTGSIFGRRPFNRNATAANNFGFAWEWQPTQKFKWGGWWGIALAEQKAGGNNNATLINWATIFSFPDLFAEGNSGGIIIGMPPKVIYNSLEARQDPATSFHFEVSYRYKVNEFINFNPGFYVVTKPNHDPRNSPIWVTLIRTQFRF